MEFNAHTAALRLVPELRLGNVEFRGAADLNFRSSTG